MNAFRPTPPPLPLGPIVIGAALGFLILVAQWVFA